MELTYKMVPVYSLKLAPSEVSVLHKLIRGSAPPMSTDDELKMLTEFLIAFDHPRKEE